MASAAVGRTTGPPHEEPRAPPPEAPSADRLVRVRFVADVDRIAPGAAFHLAAIFEIEPHWHIYWVDPGMSGAPTMLDVTAPEGFVVGETEFPRPRTFGEPDGVTFGYERETALFVPVRAPDTLGEGEAVFALDAFFLVCRDGCLIGQAMPTLRLPTTGAAAGSARERGEVAALLERFRRRVPQRLGALDDARITLIGGRLTITGPLRGFAGVELFPIQSPGVTFGEPEITASGERFRIEVGVEISRKNSLGKPMAVAGVVGLGRELDDPSYHFELPLGVTHPEDLP